MGFSIIGKINQLGHGRNKKFFRYGLPFIIMVVGGSFALKEFTQVKFEYFSKPSIKQEDMASHGIKMKGKGEVTIDTEYEKVKKIDIDHWEQKRGPRPWEEKL